MKWLVGAVSLVAFLTACVLADAYYDYQDCVRVETGRLMAEVLKTGRVPAGPEPKVMCDGQSSGQMLRRFTLR